MTSPWQTAATESLVGIWHKPPRAHQRLCHCCAQNAITSNKCVQKSVSMRRNRRRLSYITTVVAPALSQLIWPECCYCFQSIGPIWRGGNSSRFQVKEDGCREYIQVGETRATVTLRTFVTHCSALAQTRGAFNAQDLSYCGLDLFQHSDNILDKHS